jgi:hypothetical protein
MSWKSLTPLKFARSDGKTTIAVQARSVAIRLGPEIMARAGWEPGTRVDVLVGDGDDLGMVRLVKHRMGWSIQRQGGKNGREVYGVLRVNKRLSGLGVFPSLPESLSAKPIAVEFKSGGIEFRLPWITRFADCNLPIKSNGVLRATPSATVVPRAGTLA